ncbi:hypothetical protein LTR08_004420 [Meristemomyces frigidus]|nr:hypothetical protein LTR08_004420 [Meristemomyces frigidus]
MLHWLAGQKAPETSDPDATGYVEPPETPAPVFAVRAFKHAIFGTPQTIAQPKPRRHSNSENQKPRPTGVRSERPALMRPKSSGDVHGFSQEKEPPCPEPMNSPTKGILMTPGTAAGRRKTVTFGEHVSNNEEKRITKSGLPDDCPGKFPSPWVKPSVAEVKDEEPTEKGRGRNKLTEALEQVREESAKRKRSDRRTNFANEDEPSTTHVEPKSDSGKYWKAQYDVYRENTQREVKKLIAKQKMAKSFAKDKDFQCTDLADQLRQEKRKVERLETKAAGLETRLKEMQTQLSSQKSELTHGARSDYKQDPGRISGEYGAVQVLQHLATSQAPRKVEAAPNPTMLRNEEQHRPVPEQPTAEAEPHHAKTKARPVNVRTKTSDDIWNMSLGSSPVHSRPAERQFSPPKPGRAVTSGTIATPLKSLSVNTLGPGTLPRRDSAQPSPPNDRFAKEALVRQEVLPSANVDEGCRISPTLAENLPQPAPEPQAIRRHETPRSPSPRKSSAAAATDESSIQVPLSSPFEPNPVLSPLAGHTKRSYFDRAEEAGAKTNDSPEAKENITPPMAGKPAQAETVKPMAAWAAINAPAATKRVASLTDKTGKEVGIDRIAAARIRLAERRRNMS